MQGNNPTSPEVLVSPGSHDHPAGILGRGGVLRVKNLHQVPGLCLPYRLCTLQDLGQDREEMSLATPEASTDPVLSFPT